MKAKLLTTGLAAILMSACSSAAGPFDGQTPEEVAMFILGGLQKGDSVSWPDGGGLTVNTIQEKPLTLEIAGSQSFATFTVTDQGNCTFLYEVTDRTPNQAIGTLQATANLTHLTTAKAHPSVKTITLEGAKIQCVAIPNQRCEDLQPALDKGDWWRKGMIKDVRGKKERDAMEQRLNDAIQYLRTNICKP